LEQALAKHGHALRRLQLMTALALLKHFDGDSFDGIGSTHDDQCRTEAARS